MGSYTQNLAYERRKEYASQEYVRQAKSERYLKLLSPDVPEPPIITQLKEVQLKMLEMMGSLTIESDRRDIFRSAGYWREYNTLLGQSTIALNDLPNNWVSACRRFIFNRLEYRNFDRIRTKYLHSKPKHKAWRKEYDKNRPPRDRKEYYAARYQAKKAKLLEL